MTSSFLPPVPGLHIPGQPVQPPATLCYACRTPIEAGQRYETLDLGHATAAAHLEPGRPDGLTCMEGKVMDALVEAVNTFNLCERQHPDEMRDFADGIHRCQDTLALRIARRAFPEGWPVKEP